MSEVFENVAKEEAGTVYYDERSEGVRLLVLRGPCSVNAYLGVPLSHPLAGFHYDDLPLDVHGGLTFSSEGGGDSGFPEDWFWYGWDYAHAGDRPMYDSAYGEKGKAWTPEMVYREAREALWDFKRLVRLAEKIAEGK